MKLTPMLEQYFEIKRQVPDAILFYRLGDFYEMFFEDAETAAPILDLVLTARGKGGDWEAPMCGVPFHAADQYVAKLVRKGFRVALCDQVGEAGATKGIVPREVVRIITPGTAVESYLLEREGCYLLALAPGEDGLGAAWLDVSTGEFFVTRYQGKEDPRLEDDLARFSPREVLHPRGMNGAPLTRGGEEMASTAADDGMFSADAAWDLLTRHFRTQSLRGFGLERGDGRIAAAGAALRYAEVNHKRDLGHVLEIRIDQDADCLILDASTLENLEIFESRDGGRTRSALWNVLDETKTAMGARTLRRWIARPLRARDLIFERHDAVEELTRDPLLLEAVCARLATIGDLERFASRITLGSATPRELLALDSSLGGVADLATALAGARGPLLAGLRGRLDPIDDLRAEITKHVEPSPPPSVRDGGAIRAGIDAELDSLRAIARDSKSILLRIEAEERELTSIPSLKVRFNSVFGYYIEVSKANLARVPDRYIRKQTLVNAERYITPELKELEEKIIGSEEKSLAIELRIWDGLLARLGGWCGPLLADARVVGEVDSLASLATVARRRRYVRPRLSDLQEIEIEQGRHPVIETLTERFIPNDTSIRRDENGIQIITGPNMGGKSTYLRQVALIVLMNQIGGFVPAASARLGVFDRIFTRVGASDNLARGESTFMVEMHETANILHNATPESLIVLDEVGRGTATFDGLSLAWAIIEFLHDEPRRAAITLFATHYHELTDLGRTRGRVANANVSVREWNDQIVFLRKVVPGAADKSYGIQVAKLAGIPPSVIDRAREILSTLERKERDVVEETSAPKGEPAARGQLSLFDRRENEVVRRIRSLDLEAMSPLEALNTLADLQAALTGKRDG
ncbi:MAG TPA: DNA mismatch repair protein MutS [Thermoanaerobaculia bacterium]|nr:DNA mismatch repair protein MutS [Thermoanaerobaculia bacterium]